MSEQRLVQVGVPSGNRDGIGQAIQEVVASAFADARLLSTPRLELVDGPIAVRIDGELLPVSSRKMEQALLAGTGSFRRQDEYVAAPELVRNRLAAADPTMAASIVSSLVEAALRAARPAMIRAERVEIASRLMGRADLMGSLSTAVGLAADLGVNAVILAEGGIDNPPPEPYAAAEWLVQQCLEREQPEPIIQAEPRTLTRLTTPPRMLRAELILGTEPPSPLGVAHRLYRSYGVTLPVVRLRLEDERTSQVRFSFGAGGHSAAHLVPSDDLAVVTLPPRDLPTPAAPYLDPFLGDSWALVPADLVVDALVGTSGARVLDPAAVVLNSLLAEMATRLPLWAPTGDALGLDQLGQFEGLPMQAISAAVRHLLASRVSLQSDARMKEAAILLAAARLSAIDQIEAGLRALLGRAVVPPTARTTGVVVVEIDEALATAATVAGSIEILVKARPELLTATSDLIVTVPHPLRRAVELLVRPLADVVVVVSDAEYAQMPIAPTKMTFAR